MDEILVHINAPTTRKGDDVYLSLADAYLAFEPDTVTTAATSDIEPHSTNAHEKNAGQDPSGSTHPSPSPAFSDRADGYRGPGVLKSFTSRESYGGFSPQTPSQTLMGRREDHRQSGKLQSFASKDSFGSFGHPTPSQTFLDEEDDHRRPGVTESSGNNDSFGSYGHPTPGSPTFLDEEEDHRRPGVTESFANKDSFSSFGHPTPGSPTFLGQEEDHRRSGVNESFESKDQYGSFTHPTPSRTFSNRAEHHRASRVIESFASKSSYGSFPSYISPGPSERAPPATNDSLDPMDFSYVGSNTLVKLERNQAHWRRQQSSRSTSSNGPRSSSRKSISIPKDTLYIEDTQLGAQAIVSQLSDDYSMTSEDTSEESENETARDLHNTPVMHRTPSQKLNDLHQEPTSPEEIPGTVLAHRVSFMEIQADRSPAGSEHESEVEDYRPAVLHQTPSRDLNNLHQTPSSTKVPATIYKSAVLHHTPSQNFDNVDQVPSSVKVPDTGTPLAKRKFNTSEPDFVKPFKFLRKSAPPLYRPTVLHQTSSQKFDNLNQLPSSGKVPKTDQKPRVSLLKSQAVKGFIEETPGDVLTGFLDFNQLPSEVLPPAPEVSIKTSRTWPSQTTAYLDGLKKQNDGRWKPSLYLRGLAEDERGCWVVETDKWPRKAQYDFWCSLSELVKKDSFGWGVYLCREPTDSGNAKSGLGKVRLYCWGEVVEGIWLALWLCSQGKVSDARWLDAEETAILLVP